MITDREDPSGIQIDRTVLSVRDAMDGMTEERVVSSIGIGIGITVGWVGCKFVYSRFIFKWDRNNLNFFKMLQKKPIYTLKAGRKCRPMKVSEREMKAIQFNAPATHRDQRAALISEPCQLERS